LPCYKIRCHDKILNHQKKRHKIFLFLNDEFLARYTCFPLQNL
jgi:hypothetical protein